MARRSRWLPWGFVVLGLLYVLSSMRPAPAIQDAHARLAWMGPVRGAFSSGPSSNPRDQMHLAKFAALPVMDHGRVKPIDSFARVQLMLASRKQEWADGNGQTQPAVRWLLNLLAYGAQLHANTLEMPNADDRAWFGLPDGEGDVFAATRVEGLLRKKQNEFIAIVNKPEDKRNPQEQRVFMIAALAVERADRVRKMAGSVGKTDPAVKMKVFRIDFDQVLAMVKQERRDGFRYSVEEIGQKGALEVAKRAREANGRVEAKDPRHPVDTVDQRCMELARQLDTFSTLAQLGGLTLVPDDTFSPNGWKTLGDTMEGAQSGKPAEHLIRIVNAYAMGDAKTFNEEVDAYATLARENLARQASLARQEAWFNQFAPFYRCAALYVLVFVLAVLSWMVWQQPMLRAAFALLLLVFAVHTFALIYRMYIQGRPPVTNLYSSAVFIGWGCAAVCLYLDWRIYWNGIPTAVAGLLGFSTMIIAQFLGSSGDTMEVLDAVLDTTFWLATHVTIVTLGYTATFVAGFLATVYLYRMLAGTVVAFFRNRGNPAWSNPWAFTMAMAGVAMVPAMLALGFLWGLIYLFTGDDPNTNTFGEILKWVVPLLGAAYAVMVAMRWFSPAPEDRPGDVPPSAQWMERLELNVNSAKALSNEVYGVVCFAVLLSFVGTVLGGIWADQSWGRFWGWDPKENGAILVVIINALILHARWGGMIRERGLVILALIGNMTTMWSWFGTNQLGIGLHSYGFNKALVTMCSTFWVAQLLLIGLASLPAQYWKSYTARPEEKQGKAATGAVKTKPAAKGDPRIAPA